MKYLAVQENGWCSDWIIVFVSDDGEVFKVECPARGRMAVVSITHELNKTLPQRGDA